MAEREDVAGSFGQRLRQLRKDRKLTQQALADLVGIDVTYLSKLENDKDSPPGDDTIRRIAANLHSDSEELLALAGKIPPAIKLLAAADPQFAQLLRRLPDLPKDRLHAIYRQAGLTRAREK